MAKPKSLKNAGATPGKLSLIAVLAVVLGGVLYNQFGRSQGESVAAPASVTDEPAPNPVPQVASRVKASTAGTPATTDASSLSRPEPFDQKLWKSPELATVVQYDPFALPSAFPQPAQVAADGQKSADGTDAAAADDSPSKLADAVDKLHKELEELRQRGVHVIVRQGDQYAALIGDRTIHVGDEINGFTVTAIEPDGVRVERKVQQ